MYALLFVVEDGHKDVAKVVVLKSSVGIMEL
jgi:hypothetical protein